jgi:hypothetical protein
MRRAIQGWRQISPGRDRLRGRPDKSEKVGQLQQEAHPVQQQHQPQQAQQPQQQPATAATLSNNNASNHSSALRRLSNNRSVP